MEEMKEEMQTATPQKKSLVGKLASVMAQISRVKKNGVNKFQNYNYATEADLVEEVRVKLGEAGVFILTSIEEVGTAETGRKTSGGMSIKITRVKAKHTFCDSDSSATIEAISYGEGEDSGDKGIYKAVTGAVKYFLSKNFLMSTGDDPENDEVDHPKGKQEKPRTRAQQLGPFANATTMAEHEKEEESKAEAPSQQDFGSIEVTIVSGGILRKSEPKDPKKWTLYKIDTHEFGALKTFSKSVYDMCGDACTKHLPIILHTEPTGKGPEIKTAEWPAAKPSSEKLESKVA